MSLVFGHPNISCYLADPFGSRLADASKFVSLKYTRVVNGIGTAILVLPATFNSELILLPDGRVEIWRRLPGTSREYLDTDTTWLIKKVRYERDDRGREIIIIEADTPLCILREPGRFINYAAGGTTSVSTSEAADDALKRIASLNIGSSISAGQEATRNIAAYVSIAPNLTLGAAISKSYAWRDILKVMQEIAASSTQAGTYLAFDIVAPTPSSLEFRTYIGQRGVDHRFPSGANPIIIGPAFGNMGACFLEYDYRNEITYALAGGKGEGAGRLTASAKDDTRIGASPFGYREKFIDATQYDTTTGLSAEAQAAVRQGRPRSRFQGKLIDTPDTRYGVHWSWGDFVTVQAFGKSFDCRIDAISVTIDKGKETVEAVLRNDA